jgi:hypothetical protein
VALDGSGELVKNAAQFKDPREVQRGTPLIVHSGDCVMKPSAQRIGVLSTAVVLGIATAEIYAEASGVGPISERKPVLMVQGAGSHERPQVSEPISETARVLVGHWRKTTIVFEQPEDEHLVLYTNGTAENWVATASGHSPPTTGIWNVEGKMLNLLLEGHEQISQPFTIYEEQLVFPNIPNRRRFWEKIGR